MRKEFSAWMESYAGQTPEAVFLTGDLGFMALEGVQKTMGERFINAGVSEQNMISVAAGLAQQGLKPFCYSIAPFTVFRPMEQIRLDVCLHHLNVKIVGNGGGYGYGIMGATHHALEDLAVLSPLANMRCFVPYCNEEVAQVCHAMSSYAGPSYLRLGAGARPEGIEGSPEYAPVRRLAAGGACTVIGIGPVILNAVAACRADRIEADIFAVSELPVIHWGSALHESVQRTGKVLVVEEHVARGGLGEHTAAWCMQKGLNPRWVQAAALGYPNGRYGGQAYHQKISGLDVASLQAALRGLMQA
jgi:transketolase